MKHIAKIIYEAFVVLSVTSSLLYGQVKEIKPFVRNDRLQFDAALDNFFNEKVTGTILSGLPMDMSLSWKLVDGNAEIARGEHALQIHYDVWDEIFSLRNATSEKKFTSLDSLQSYMNSIRNIDVISFASLSRDRFYTIRLRILIKQIGAEQDRTFWDWLNDTEESSIEENSGKEFHFSLSGLLQLFFGSSQSKKSGWFDSRSFKLSELSNQ
ncbi:DUF4390 domain-containing protein [bacterium]|nr:DUF4390 domain-containing protein [bacterium]